MEVDGDDVHSNSDAHMDGNRCRRRSLRISEVLAAARTAGTRSAPVYDRVCMCMCVSVLVLVVSSGDFVCPDGEQHVASPVKRLVAIAIAVAITVEVAVAFSLAIAVGAIVGRIALPVSLAVSTCGAQALFQSSRRRARAAQPP
jgi:hypothetical protein